tara:strand:- start:4366 stop:4959 length:594 start_codon:yes stop_codon:yes gene_type:complete
MKMTLSQNVKNNTTEPTKSSGGTMNYTNIKHNNFMSTPTTSYRSAKGGMTWGGPTWIFLHTIVEKTKDEHFGRLRNELLKNIYMICTNLPCPDCSLHAKNYLNNQNFNAILNKSQLKTMLYEFHNSVNEKKGFALFNKIDLNSRYQNKVLSVTFYNFLIKFKDRGANNRFIHEDIYRSQLSKDLVKWFNANKEYFNE